MKRMLWLWVTALGSVFYATSNLALAGHQDPKTAQDWRWEDLEALFPHTPGTRWVYALSGKQYINGGELQVEVKGRQHLPPLKQEVLLVDETHPAAVTDSSPEVIPVLYYPREGYLVRDTAHIYSNPQRTSLMSTGNLGEAVMPVLPLWQHVDGTDWKPVDTEHWGRASRLSLAYHIHPEKRETVTLKSGSYQDCVLVAGSVNRGEEDGYRYQEWYAPGVGLVKSVTADLRTNQVIAQKELISFHPPASTTTSKQ